MSIDPIILTQQLIQRKSVTPADDGCLDLISSYLEPMGFVCHRLPFGDTDNLYALLGTDEPHLCFLGHTDVVPTGPLDRWTFDPFSGAIKDGHIYGRGAVDMKGGIAAFVAAISRVIQDADFSGSISILLTSDEEGPATNGTTRVVDWLKEKQEIITACIVGEPTSVTALGDTAKIGRRGSLNTIVTVSGKQGHVAYPHLAANPIPALIRYLHQLLSVPLDHGTDAFSPTNLEITSVDVGNPTTNMIPGSASARFNIRFNPLHTGESLKAHLNDVLDGIKADDKNALNWQLETRVSGEAFLCDHPPLHQLVKDAVGAVTGLTPDLNTTGGTSDARFMREICPCIEIGLKNATAHHVDERVAIEDLEQLTRVYEEILRNFGAVLRRYTIFKND
ncbi:MAG: succinyl-diaminopimelate desuccinylase [Alphaproteobacteria bacterium]|nr:succinyl-diaminopimelate desuccinylase [Alphaproteobacteria bacterium]